MHGQSHHRIPFFVVYKVHPSGFLKAGKDYWVAQAAAGDTFSVTREANWEDAARAIEGFLWMKAVRYPRRFRYMQMMASSAYFRGPTRFAGLAGAIN